MLFRAVDAGGIEGEFPRGGIVVAVGADGVGDVVVVKLPDAAGEPALLAEGLRQAELIRNGLPENQRITLDAGAVRIEAREHRITTGPAEWIRAVSTVEADTARGEPVDVGRARERIAVGSEHRVQIVGDEEEDVFRGRRRGRLRGRRVDEEESKRDEPSV